jgi:hypothetical protein
MIPLWVFLCVTIPLVAVVVALIYLHFVRNPLPFPDWGNAIFVCPERSARQTVIAVLESNGITPDKRIDSELALRALFMNRFRFVLNVTEPTEWERLGKPVAALAIVTDNPDKAAHKAVEILQHAGYQATAFYDPDKSVPAHSMAFVSSTAHPGWLLVFRRHFIKMGKMPARWIKDQ